VRVVYADLAFLLNALLDYLALCCTVRLTGFPVRQVRLAASAVFGGLYGVFAMIGKWENGMLPWIAALVMTGIVFGWDRWILRRYILFLCSACVLSGAATAVQAVLLKGESVLLVFVVSAGFCAFALAVVFSGSGKEQHGRVQAELLYQGRKLRLTLLRDSGNTLRDPCTGEVLCIIWSKALAPLFAGRKVAFHQIPYQSLGTEQGELLYFYCDAITVGGVTYYHYPVGLARHALSDGCGFVGLWGGGKDQYAGYMEAGNS